MELREDSLQQPTEVQAKQALAWMEAAVEARMQDAEQQASCRESPRFDD